MWTLISFQNKFISSFSTVGVKWLKELSMILFGILGSYLFLNIWEYNFINIGKMSAKIHEIGKIKAILDWE